MAILAILAVAAMAFQMIGQAHELLAFRAGYEVCTFSPEGHVSCEADLARFRKSR